MQKSKAPSFLKPIGKIFSRFHMTIFIVFIIGCLAAAVLLLTNILNDASITDDYNSSIDAGSIDQVTLDRINSLHTSDDTLPPVTTSSVRSNPFTE